MGPVARELLGEPSSERPLKHELRFGTRGSLAVRTDLGTWHDHERGEGGGVLDFVQTRRNLDKEGAVAWLIERGHLPQPDPAKGTSKREVAKAVALSALITPVVRGALSVAPLHTFRANTPGTGKSYLADVASAISAGQPCPVASAADGNEETEKRIAALLLGGYPIVSLDNVNGELGGDLLAQAIERPLIRLRPLGASTIVEVEARATIFATGNNLRVRGDMVRRTLVCDLDAGMEQPETRQFRGNPVETVLRDRGRYVSACLIIVRAYIAAGCPNVLPKLASFEDWSNLVRSSLVWLNCADPLASMAAARNDDPELAELREILGLWSAAFGTDAYTAKEVVAEAERRHPTKMGEPTDLMHPELLDAFTRLFGST